jgi:hypothetical protein
MNFPLDLRFKAFALGQQISVFDSTGELVFYVKQKAFKLKEQVTVFADKEQTKPLYAINANKVLDISARYAIDNADGGPLGAIQRKGMRSIWRAHYDVHLNGNEAMTIREEKPWVKVFDALLGEVPILGAFTGYFFHPSYLLTKTGSDEPVMRLKKQPAFLEGKFQIEQLSPMKNDEETLAVLSQLMMLVLERRRG